MSDDLPSTYDPVTGKTIPWDVAPWAHPEGKVEYRLEIPHRRATTRSTGRIIILDHDPDGPGWRFRHVNKSSHGGNSLWFLITGLSFDEAIEAAAADVFNENWKQWARIAREQKAARMDGDTP